MSFLIGKFFGGAAAKKDYAPPVEIKKPGQNSPSNAGEQGKSTPATENDQSDDNMFNDMEINEKIPSTPPVQKPSAANQSFSKKEPIQAPAPKEEEDSMDDMFEGMEVKESAPVKPRQSTIKAEPAPIVKKSTTIITTTTSSSAGKGAVKTIVRRRPKKVGDGEKPVPESSSPRSTSPIHKKPTSSSAEAVPPTATKNSPAIDAKPPKTEKISKDSTSKASKSSNAAPVAAQDMDFDIDFQVPANLSSSKKNAENNLDFDFGPSNDAQKDGLSNDKKNILDAIDGFLDEPAEESKEEKQSPAKKTKVSASSTKPKASSAPKEQETAEKQEEKAPETKKKPEKESILKKMPEEKPKAPKTDFEDFTDLISEYEDQFIGFLDVSDKILRNKQLLTNEEIQLVSENTEIANELEEAQEKLELFLKTEEFLEAEVLEKRIDELTKSKKQKTRKIEEIHKLVEKHEKNLQLLPSKISQVEKTFLEKLKLIYPQKKSKFESSTKEFVSKKKIVAERIQGLANKLKRAEENYAAFSVDFAERERSIESQVDEQNAPFLEEKEENEKIIESLSEEISKLEMKILELKSKKQSHLTIIEKANEKIMKNRSKFSKEYEAIEKEKKEKQDMDESLKKEKENYEQQKKEFEIDSLRFDNEEKTLSALLKKMEMSESFHGQFMRFVDDFIVKTFAQEEKDTKESEKKEVSEEESKELQELKQKYAKVNENINSMEEQVKSQNQEVENLQTSNQNIDSEIPQVSEEKEAAVSQRNWKKAAELKTKLKDLQDLKLKNENSIKEIEEAICESDKEKADLQKDLDEIGKKIENFQKKKDEESIDSILTKLMSAEQLSEFLDKNKEKIEKISKYPEEFPKNTDLTDFWSLFAKIANIHVELNKMAIQLIQKRLFIGEASIKLKKKQKLPAIQTNLSQFFQCLEDLFKKFGPVEKIEKKVVEEPKKEDAIVEEPKKEENVVETPMKEEKKEEKVAEKPKNEEKEAEIEEEEEEKAEQKKMEDDIEEEIPHVEEEEEEEEEKHEMEEEQQIEEEEGEQDQKGEEQEEQTPDDDDEMFEGMEIKSR